MPTEDYITRLFVLISDLYHEFSSEHQLRKAGFPPILHDSEVISMILSGEFLKMSEDKQIYDFFFSSFLPLFPNLKKVSYKTFQKQITNLWHVLDFIKEKMRSFITQDGLYLADGFPVPTCHLERRFYSRLFKGHVAKHYCAAKKEYYYGFKVVVLCNAQGVPLDYSIGAANVDERTLMKHIRFPSEGGMVIADKGFIGEEIKYDLKHNNNIDLITPMRRNMKFQWSRATNNLICRTRKKVETTINQLSDRFHMNTTKARSLHGLLGKMTRKVLSFMTASFLNSQIVKDHGSVTELSQLISH